jgi:hypothetical protein
MVLFSAVDIVQASHKCGALGLYTAYPMPVHEAYDRQ